MTVPHSNYARIASPRAVSVALLLVTGLVFWEVQYYGFFPVDDQSYVIQNAATLEGLSLPNVTNAFTEFQISNYHPLTMVSLMADSSLFGATPAAFHRTNVALHLANTFLVFWVLWSMTQSLWPSAAVALLFGIHPLHVEPVVWISSRKDVLSTFFMLAAIACYVRFVRTRSPKVYAALNVFPISESIDPSPPNSCWKRRRCSAWPSLSPQSSFSRSVRPVRC